MPNTSTVFSKPFYNYQGNSSTKIQSLFSGYYNAEPLDGIELYKDGTFKAVEFVEWVHDLPASHQKVGMFSTGRVYSEELDEFSSSSITFENSNGTYITKANEFIEELQITEYVELTSLEDVVNELFPVNTIYETIDDTNPGTFLPGTTWTRIAENRALVAAGSTFTAGSTGGSKYLGKHSHTESMAVNSTGSTHNHNSYIRTDAHLGGTGSGFGWSSDNDGTTSSVIYDSGNSNSARSKHTHTIPSHNTEYTGNGMTFNGTTNYDNMPPYQTVYIWKRTS